MKEASAKTEPEITIWKGRVEWYCLTCGNISTAGRKRIAVRGLPDFCCALDILQGPKFRRGSKKGPRLGLGHERLFKRELNEPVRFGGWLCDIYPPVLSF